MKKKLLLFITIFVVTVLSNTVPAKAEWSLTEEEKEYIKNCGVIKAASIERVAPLSFRNASGEIQGIFKRVMDEISDMTGLVFEYELYPSVEDVLDSNSDIVYGFPSNYAPDNMVLSTPFLETQTILYLNMSVNPDNLEDKIYAGVSRGTLPAGIKEENTIYFNTREESMNAVEKGTADYGYGNSYSVAYYSLINNYENMVTIPQEKERREYCIGFLNYDEVLHTIINKSISSIDPDRMHKMIIDEASNLEKKITFSMIMDVYGRGISLAILIIIVILLISVVSNVRAKNKLRLQNLRYEVLANISNEYLYQYSPNTNHLELSERCIQLFESKEVFNEASEILKYMLAHNNKDRFEELIKIPLANGKTRIFKAINSSIYDKDGRIDSIIGKLIDISKDMEEKEELIAKSQEDGLTGLLNAATTKRLIAERLENKEEHKLDAFMLIDCDNFKDINDKHGHLIGNQILEKIGEILKQKFRGFDIVGRFGGDEFCIYMKDIPSVDIVKDKFKQLNDDIQNINDMGLTTSAGIALVRDHATYEQIFKKADAALYEAKNNDKSHAVVSDE